MEGMITMYIVTQLSFEVVAGKGDTLGHETKQQSVYMPDTLAFWFILMIKVSSVCLSPLII